MKSIPITLNCKEKTVMMKNYHTAIVTGASGNLGQAVVKKFMAEGFFVIGTVIPNDPEPMNFPRASFEKVYTKLWAYEGASGVPIDDVLGPPAASSVPRTTVSETRP